MKKSTTTQNTKTAGQLILPAIIGLTMILTAFNSHGASINACLVTENTEQIENCIKELKIKKKSVTALKKEEERKAKLIKKINALQLELKEGSKTKKASKKSIKNTAKKQNAFKNCIKEVMNDKTGYEMDESEASELCQNA